MIFILLTIFTLLIPLDNKTSVWLNFGGGINLTNIFIFFLLIGWVINSVRKGTFFIKSPLNLPVILFILLTLASFLTGYLKLGIPFFGDEFRAFKNFITTFILFFIIANNVKEKKHIKLLLGILSFMIILVTLICIKEFRGADIWHYDEGTRIEIFGMQPNMLGAFFAQYIPIFAGFFYMMKKNSSKIFYLFLFTISLPALMFTYSRGAYLSIIGALLMMAILGGGKSFRMTVILILFAIFTSSLAFGRGHIVPVSVKERFDMIKQPDEDKSVALRKEVWALAKEYIRGSPVVGYGYGASDQLLYLESIKGRLDTHNMYLDIALESGIPTLLVLIWILLVAIKISWKAFRNSHDDFYKAISLGCIGSITALAIGNYFGTRLTFFAANGYFAILLGIVARIYSEQAVLNKRKKVIVKNSK